jgi:cell wall assembly regulator SMI1
MPKALEQVFSDFTGGAPASSETIEHLEKSLGKRLPREFCNFLRLADGAEGFVGDNYLMLWSADEIARYNAAYQVDEYAPGLVLFGSDGGGEGYAFDMRTGAAPVVMVPFVGMDLQYAKAIAPSFDSFLQYLGTPDGQLH